MIQIPKWKTHANGLETMLVEKHDSPIIKFNIVLRFGSYEDPPGKEGMVNFIGDMLLRGTKTKSRDKIEFMLDHLGAMLSVYTGYHSFVIEGRVLTKNFKPLLELVKEILTSPLFHPDEIQKLKNEIKADLLLRLEDDQDLAKHHFFKEVYGKHLYAREVVGTPTSIDSITTKELSDYFEKFVNRVGMLVGAAGDINEELFEKVANDIFGLLPEASILPTLAAYNESIEGMDIVLIDKPGLSQTQFFIGHPCISINHPDYLSLDVFMTGFAGSMFQAKYMQEIRVKRGWSYGAYGSVEGRRDGGSFYLYTFPKNDDTIDAIAVSLTLLDDAINGSLMDSDAIQFSKNYLFRSYPFKIDTAEKILAQKIYNKVANRPEDALETYRQRVQSVEYVTAMEKAKAHITPQNVKIVITCTASLFEEKIVARLKPKNLIVKKYNELE